MARKMQGAIAVVLALSFAAPVVAQDGSEVSNQRTVEGAQTFLSQFYSRASVWIRFSVLVSGSDWILFREPEPAGYQTAILLGDVSNVTPVGPCRSEVSYERLRTKEFLRGVPSIPLREPTGGVTRTIDWTMVEKVRVAPDTISVGGGPTGLTTVHVEWKGGRLGFDHADEADAKRVAFAMDFLREACGPKNDTGF